MIPAGERWKADGSIRFAIEDLLGAGAVIRHLGGARSPEAQVAVAAFEADRGRLLDALKACSSGKELIGMGFGDDIALIADMDADGVAPILSNGACERSVTGP